MSEIKNENIGEMNDSQNKNANTYKPTPLGIVLRIVLVVIAVYIGVLVFRRVTSKEEIVASNTAKVNIAHIDKTDIKKERSVTGTIMPSDTFYVVNKVAGEITKIYVSNGQTVKKGDKICEIDNSKQIESAFIQYDTSRKAYERMEKLYNSGDISLQSFEQVKAQYEAHKLAYDTQVEYSTPVATGDGTIENTNMTLNVTITTGTVLCYITSDEAKEIEFGVTESVLDGIKLFDDVVVEKQGKKYTGTIKDKSNLINSKTGLFDVKATIDDDNNFASGVAAKVTFVYEEKENIYALPKKIVYYENTKPFVYVIGDEGKVTKKFFGSGIENTDKIEVTSGISTSDDIIVTWSSDLAEGAVVDINEEVNLWTLS